MSEQRLQIDADPEAWARAIKMLASETPQYRVKSPNVHHVHNAILKLGYTSVTDENIYAVFEALSERKADENETTVLPEAPASWNTTYYKAGFREQITLRGVTYSQIAEQAELARAWIRENADTPYNQNGASNGAQPKQDKQVTVSMEPMGGDYIPNLPDGFSEPEYVDIVETSAPVPQQVETTGGLSFKPETLVANVTDGKTYWKVKGGRWSKYGVTIWPEVLEAANLRDLDPTQQYSLTNFKTAIYINNEKGQPSKVLQLTS